MGTRTLVTWLLLLGIGFSATPAHSYALLNSRRPNATYVFEVGLSLSASTTSPSGPTWDSAYAEAAANWNAVSPLVNLSVTQGVAHDPCNTSDGFHTAQFAPDICTTPFGSSTLAIARLIRSGGYTIDGAIHFNNSSTITWDIYTGNLRATTDFRRVALHELGHLLGLDHENSATSIMAPLISDLEDPQSDDISGISAMYNLGCPVYHNVSAGTVNGALAITDCFDTEDGPLPLPNNGAALPHTTSVIADSDAFVDLYRVSMPSGGTLSATIASTDFIHIVQILDSTATTELGVEWMPPPALDDPDFLLGNPITIAKTVAPGDYVIVTRGIQAGRIGSYSLTLVPEPSRAALALAALAVLVLLGKLRAKRRTVLR